MPDNIRLENPIYGVNLTLSTEAALFSNGGSSNYVHTQSSASTSWTVTHNLNKYCSVTVVDNNDDVVIGEIHYNSVDQVTLTFTAAFSGKAFFN
jgi:hypothetical protein